MKLAPLVLLLLPATALARPEPDRALTYAIPVDGYPSDGPADAKVTLVMAQDYADPFSQRTRATLDELRKKYGNELRIVFRNMVVHPHNAMASALASCAAHKQRTFEAMEERLWGAFAQRQWDVSEIDLGNGPQKCWDTVDGCRTVVGFATDLGLKVDRFKADMRGCVQTVADDMAELQRFAVNATPTFFINGRYTAGAQPTENFTKLIDEELGKATARIKQGTPKARYYRTWIVDKGEPKVDPAAAPTPTQPTPMPMPRPGRLEPDPALTYAVPVAGYPANGPSDALVTLVIAHDYADPYSDRNRATLAELRKQYGRDLRVVYRNLVVHPRQAMAGALASCAAHRQNKFDAMETKLWEGFAQRSFDSSEIDQGNGPQKCWDLPEGCAISVGFAKAAGLDVGRFKADMKGACQKIVADDMAELQGSFALGATPSFFVNGRYLAGAMPIETFATLIDAELAKANAAVKTGVARARFYQTSVLGKGEPRVVAGGAPATGVRPVRPTPDPAKAYALKTDGYPSKGPADAKVTIVMFFDYATPYADRVRPTLDELAQRYGKELRVVYRTRLVHPSNAHASALALCAAHKAGKAVAMDEALWEKGFKQRNLDPTTVQVGNDSMKCWDAPEGCKAALAIAQDVGLPLKQFRADMQRCVPSVEADDQDGMTNFAVNATPTFFINGRYLAGAQPVEAFAAIVDDELAKASERIKQGTPKGRYYQTWILGKGERSVR